MLPQIKILYTCFDLPQLCRVGKELLPDVDFQEDPNLVFNRKYDLVFASGSIQYSENWREVVSKLSEVAQDYLFITRIETVKKAESFVTVQRAYKIRDYGYNTQYLGWVFNKQEFIKSMEKAGMLLVREFLLGPGAKVYKAPEQSVRLGFLFKHNTR